MAGLALADGCLRATQTASAHLELKYNGDHVSLNSSVRGRMLISLVSRSLHWTISATHLTTCVFNGVRRGCSFYKPISAGQGEKGTLT
jgi:hypothetical protein